MFNKKIFNSANLFLVIILSLVIWNSLIYTKISESQATTQKQQKEIVFRTLESDRDLFNRLVYTIWTDSGIYIAYSPELLEVGREYAAFTQIDTYNINNKKEVYKLSLGVVGEVNIKKVKAINLNCDFLCKFIKQTSSWKRSIQTTYFTSYCGENKEIINFLLPKGGCKDVHALAVGLVLGGTQGFSAELKNDFRKLGLSHLVAVSGFQVVLSVSFVEFLLLKLNIRRSWRLLLSIAGILFLFVMVGPQPPVLRSGISMSVSLVGLFFLGRRLGSVRALFYSLILMLVVNPFYLYSVSFQLSGLATLGLICAPKIDIPGQNRFVMEMVNGFVLTCFTFLFTLPVIVNLSGFVSPVSIIANVLILPFTTIITMGNILGLVPGVGNIFFVFNSIMESLILFMVKDLSQYAPKLLLTKFNWPEFIVYYLVLFVVAEVLKTLLQKNDTQILDL